MRYLFIFKSSLKKKKAYCDALQNLIAERCGKEEFEIFWAESAAEACQKAVAVAEAAYSRPSFSREALGHEDICICVGGGDGSIQMIAEAVWTYPNVILTVVPVGTGNDFIRSFGKKQDFIDLKQLVKGKVARVDLIRANDRIAVNMINIGFDESVVRRVDQLKRWPLMSNSVAYSICVVLQLLRYPKEKLNIRFGDGTEYNKRFLLTYIANGKYCGGGYKAASEAKLDDGLLDVLTVYPISRLRFISMVGAYKKGTLLKSKKIQKLAEFRRLERLHMSRDKDFYICLDGETISCRELEIEVIPRALRFLYPVE